MHAKTCVNRPLLKKIAAGRYSIPRHWPTDNRNELHTAPPSVRLGQLGPRRTLESGNNLSGKHASPPSSFSSIAETSILSRWYEGLGMERV